MGFAAKTARVLIASAAVALGASHLQATSLDPTPGQGLASRLCAECHDIGDGKKPAARYAPTFAYIMADPAVTEQSLRVFHRTPKEDMPNFVLATEQVDDLVAYMLSLRLR